MTVVTTRRRGASEANVCPRLRTVLSDWVVGEDGTMSRELTAVEELVHRGATADAHDEDGEWPRARPAPAASKI